ncbi:winged helix-turn-helix domain-containing protein [Nocardiopsis alkaliphila]|uniref:winged helix-turn-helix domain-containing protein n=1 Tax=Nocardiopsis alkaliphila TaxID=225762 RepID=UPI000349CE46|nr:helix-turn-helix domain-containing protein [Nocardiopsis alkaliphila]
MSEEPEPTGPRPLEVGAEALRGLAHPLRARILDELQIQGPATATILSERLGESSGSTSYHLRQLARFGFVETDPGHAGRRDRWWRVRPGGWRVSGTEFLRGPVTREAAEIVLDRYYGGRRERLQQWHALTRRRAEDPEVRRWLKATQDSVSHMRMTPEEAEEFAGELQEFLRARARRFEGRTAQSHPDTESVELQTDLFPNLVDQDIAPDER